MSALVHPSLLLLWPAQAFPQEIGGEASLEHTGKSWKAKVGGGTDCTRNSWCLTKVGDGSGNNQSSPDSLGMFLI